MWQHFLLDTYPQSVWKRNTHTVTSVGLIICIPEIHDSSSNCLLVKKTSCRRKKKVFFKVFWPSGPWSLKPALGHSLLLWKSGYSRTVTIYHFKWDSGTSGILCSFHLVFTRVYMLDVCPRSRVFLHPFLLLTHFFFLNCRLSVSVGLFQSISAERTTALLCLLLSICWSIFFISQGAAKIYTY